jgi:large subunit ribosomal protein L13
MKATLKEVPLVSHFSSSSRNPFMDMNKTFFPHGTNAQPTWRVIDANGKVLGRLATEVATALRGKDKATFTPHSDNASDYVVVINAEKILFTGNKLEDKEYVWYTGWIGGQKKLTAEEMMAKDPTRVIELAVKGMLSRTKLSRALLRRLRVYTGAEHPHTAQITRSRTTKSA